MKAMKMMILAQLERDVWPNELLKEWKLKMNRFVRKKCHVKSLYQIFFFLDRLSNPLKTWRTCKDIL